MAFYKRLVLRSYIHTYSKCSNQHLLKEKAMNELHKLLTLKKTLETDLKKPHFNKDSVLLNMYNMRNLIIINKQLLNFTK